MSTFSLNRTGSFIQGYDAIFTQRRITQKAFDAVRVYGIYWQVIDYRLYTHGCVGHPVFGLFVRSNGLKFKNPVANNSLIINTRLLDDR